MRLRFFMFIGFCSLLALAAGATPGPVRQGPHESARGASLGLFATDPSYDYGVMLEELRDRGASDVLIVYRLMQTDVNSAQMRLVPGHSPSLAAVRRTIRQARALGLRAGLMPVIGIEHRGNNEWRGSLTFDGEPHAWFAAYRTHLEDAARIATEEHVERLVVGSELSGLERFDGEWRQLIGHLREGFAGTLTYSANWDRYPHVRFWDALDEVAVSAYFRMDGGDAGALWQAHLGELRDFARSVSRPLLISEVGYPAHAHAAEVPWDETRDAHLDVAEQARLLSAFCQAHVPERDGGYYVWNWFGRGGPRDPGFSLRGKPAANVFERCMEESDDE